MAPTEGRVAKPERRWDCRHGTPAYPYKQLTQVGCWQSSTMYLSSTWRTHERSRKDDNADWYRPAVRI